MACQVEAAAIPVVKEVMEMDNRHHPQWVRRLSGRQDMMSSDNSLLFGGHPAPLIDTPYHVTVKDNRDSCHAISMMKVGHLYGEILSSL